MPYFVYLSKREYRVHVDIHILVCYKLNGIKNYKGSLCSLFLVFLKNNVFGTYKIIDFTKI